jgi:hypothetical protein
MFMHILMFVLTGDGTYALLCSWLLQPTNNAKRSSVIYKKIAAYDEIHSLFLASLPFQFLTIQFVVGIQRNNVKTYTGRMYYRKRIIALLITMMTGRQITAG